MKFGKCEIVHFGSYEELTFDYADIGFAHLQGATGSGKSTFCDIPAWILFGITAKDGSVDDVRSWSAPDAPTYGRIEVTTDSGNIRVTRIRGKQNENDLFWYDEHSNLVRGKDLADTQKLLEERLGVSADLYLTCAYFHEFNPVASFFTANAKNRRTILEKVAKLDFPVRLASLAKEARRVLKQEIVNAEKELSKAEGEYAQLDKSFEMAIQYRNKWEADQSGLQAELIAKAKNFDKLQSSKIEALQVKSELFEQDRDGNIDKLINKAKSLEELINTNKDLEYNISSVRADLRQREVDKCPTCDGPAQSEKCASLRDTLHKLEMKMVKIKQKDLELDAILAQVKRLDDEENPYKAEIARAKAEQNRYAEQAESECNKTNPHDDQVEKYKQLRDKSGRSIGLVAEIIENKSVRFDALNQIDDITFDMRGSILKRAVKQIQDSTNKALESHFESEFKVSFSIAGADALDVTITKNGRECAYRQLSKGQRQLLRLSFTISVMRAASERYGVHFDNLFLDEPFDGLDIEMRLKAFNLLEDLQKYHSSIVVIDHSSEIKELFDRRYQVTLDGEISRFEEL